MQRSGVGGRVQFMQSWPSRLNIDQWKLSGLCQHWKNNKKIQIRGIQTALLLMQPYKVAAATGEEKSEKSEWEKTNREIRLHKAVVSLMRCWNHHNKPESEIISIYDGVCGQTWATNHMLLLFISLCTLHFLQISCNSSFFLLRKKDIHPLL